MIHIGICEEITLWPEICGHDAVYHKVVTLWNSHTQLIFFFYAGQPKVLLFSDHIVQFLKVNFERNICFPIFSSKHSTHYDQMRHFEWLCQSQWSNPKNINQLMTQMIKNLCVVTTKNNKPICIFHGIRCTIYITKRILVTEHYHRWYNMIKLVHA